MEDQLKELLQFLHDRNPEARRIALNYLVGHTLVGSQYRSLFLAGVGQGQGGLTGPGPSETEVIRDLKLLCRDHPATAHDAFKSLVNLSDSSILAGPLSEARFLAFLVAYILYPESVLCDLACMILSNITAHTTPCVELLKLQVEITPMDDKGGYYTPQSRSVTAPPPAPYPSASTKSVPALPLLVDAFATATTEGGKRKGQLHFLGSVFANLSITPDGRRFFLSPHQPFSARSSNSAKYEYALASLLPFTEHPDTIRRGGVASTIKNCAFIVEGHSAMLGSEDDLIPVLNSNQAGLGLNVLPRILLPLAGPEEYELDDVDLLLPELQFLPSTKVRERDPALRSIHIQTLLLLCTTRAGREKLRKSGVYEVVRMMHETEEVEEVIDHIERLVNMLKRDEAQEVEEVKVPSGPPEDDEDERIEEI